MSYEVLDLIRVNFLISQFPIRGVPNRSDSTWAEVQTRGRTKLFEQKQDEKSATSPRFLPQVSICSKFLKPLILNFIEIKFCRNMYFDITLILFCLFRYFNCIRKIKSFIKAPASS